MNKYLLAAAALMTGVAFAAPPAQVETYVNARYGFSVAYPTALLVPQPVSGNGDGRIFAPKGGHGDFRVFANYIMDLEGIDDSPKAMVAFAAKDCPGGKPSYSVAKPHLVAVSCETPKGILYKKIMIKNGVATTLWALYPKAEKATWDPVITAMAKSLQPGDGN